MKKFNQNEFDFAKSNLYFDNQLEAINALRKEARKLRKICTIVWDEYMASYKPRKYVRTGEARRSIRIVPKIVKIDEFTLGIEVTFQNSLAYHESNVNPEKERHAIMLISYGWHSLKLEREIGKRVYRYTYYEGYNYIQKVVERYNMMKDKRISVQVNWSGKFSKRN